jgi:hypothetical protein
MKTGAHARFDGAASRTFRSSGAPPERVVPT